MLEIYIAVAVAMTLADVVFCLSMGVQYRIFASVSACALWPILVPVILIAVAYQTRQWPRLNASHYNPHHPAEQE